MTENTEVELYGIALASRLNRHEFERYPGDSEGQGSLEHCSPWGHRESDMT